LPSGVFDAFDLGLADRPAQECVASRLLLAAWEFGPRVRR
jgi:hypothetical protein